MFFKILDFFHARRLKKEIEILKKYNLRVCQMDNNFRECKTNLGFLIEEAEKKNELAVMHFQGNIRLVFQKDYF